MWGNNTAIFQQCEMLLNTAEQKTLIRKMITSRLTGPVLLQLCEVKLCMYYGCYG